MPCHFVCRDVDLIQIHLLEQTHNQRCREGVAGPHRVDAWTEERPEQSAEEFVESIPFTETRYYVMNILAAREQYRRLYALGAAPGPGGGHATGGGSR